jgi:hypothetical protein
LVGIYTYTIPKTILPGVGIVGDYSSRPKYSFGIYTYIYPTIFNPSKMKNNGKVKKKITEIVENSFNTLGKVHPHLKLIVKGT